ncbi:MAG TPA: hypothetical protein DIW24_02100 [Bacteroidetes bacterium]|nr:hypothetical protein [Bacteroidota bacterium]HRR10318.1 transposase [Rhodothermales bacterium]
MTQITLKHSEKEISLRYWALDGYFGHQTYVNLAEANGLFGVSKLKKSTSLYFSYQPPSEVKKCGPPRIYGDKINLIQRYEQYDVTHVVGNKDYALVQQFKVQSRSIKGRLLNVVVLYLDANDLTNRIVLFSTDLSLIASKMILYYRCRTQIEINFRERKQYFGLRDFKNTKECRVGLSINIAFTVCGISLILRQGYQELFGLDFVSTEDGKGNKNSKENYFCKLKAR